MCNWYALYTKSRHEKTVGKLLEEQNINVFVPLIEKLKFENQRRRYIQEPLFKSYIFARFDYRRRFEILETNGVVKIINFNGIPAVVPEWQIDSMRTMLRFPETIRLETYLKSGEIVEILDGPMKGLKGSVVKYKNEQRIMISVEGIMQSVSIEVDAEVLKRVQPQEVNQ